MFYGWRFAVNVKSSIKEKIQLCIWSVVILIVLPLFLKPSQRDIPAKNQSSEEAKNVFAEDNSEAELPEGATAIIPADLSGKIFTNKTAYSVSEDNFTHQKREKGAVLIIHTYGTQAYCNDGYITKSSTLKSKNPKENVILAGEALARYLSEMGIEVFHDKTLYDLISFSNAYNLSIESVKNKIQENPHIKYVIDIQRDSVFSQNGSCVKAVTMTERGKTAQIGFISGSDENGGDFPSWKKNLSLSLAVSNELMKTSPKLSRGVCLMPSGYGQYTCDGFMTVKLGTAGNTPSEVENAAFFLSRALYEIISL
jgi:stage II sporulation protein P